MRKVYMKKELWATAATAITYFACAVVLSRAELATVFTKQSPEGTLLKVLRESSPITLPPIEVKTWTNKDGSVSRMFPRLHRDDFDVVTYYKGHVETNGTMGRPPGPFRKDVFYVVEEAGGVARTNRALQLSQVCTVSERPLSIIDLDYEPPVAVYLYQSGGPKGPFDELGLEVAVVSSSPTNAALATTTRDVLVPAYMGDFCKMTAKHMTGSYSKGTLAVEATLIRLGSIFTRTNRFIGGKWIATESKPVPVDKAEKGESGRQ